MLAFNWKIHELKNLRCEEGSNTGEVGDSGNTTTVAEGNRSGDRVCGVVRVRRMDVRLAPYRYVRHRSLGEPVSVRLSTTW